MWYWGVEFGTCQVLAVSAVVVSSGDDVDLMVSVPPPPEVVSACKQTAGWIKEAMEPAETKK